MVGVVEVGGLNVGRERVLCGFVGGLAFCCFGGDVVCWTALTLSTKLRA